MSQSVQMERTNDKDRPLVTFALFTYNQERYIREAVEGALAQTYSPLEIILSDDCSTDRTFEIMREMANGYEGPHKIVLNQNKTNTGISTHVRHVHEISNGHIIIHAAGDDISVQERTTRLVSVFCENAESPSMVVSNAMKIDENDNELGLLCCQMDEKIIDNPMSPLEGRVPFNGCTVAIEKNLVEIFPSPNDGIIAEDVVLQRRAYLVGSVIYIPDVLVLYRCHEMAVSSGKKNRKDRLEWMNRWCEDRLLRFDQFFKDALYAGYSLSDRDELLFSRQKRSVALTLSILNNGWFIATVSLLKSFYIGYFLEKNPMYFRNRLVPYLTRWFPFLIGLKY